MATLFNPETTDAAGQVAIVEGIDSNVFQSRDAAGGTVRHPAAFTSLELSVGARGRGRVIGDSASVRAFGRYVEYHPLSGDFGRRTARGGLAYGSSYRLDRLTRFGTALVGGVGSLQAERGTDGTVTIDPVSTRRSVWSGAGTTTFDVTPSERTGVTILSTVDASGTIAETASDETAPRHRGLDVVSGIALLLLRHRLDRLTSVGGWVGVQRTHIAYTLLGGDPAGPSLDSIDGASASVAASASRLLSEETTVNGALGVTFAVPQFGERARLVPLAIAGLVHNERWWSAWALASFRYAGTEARVGPGVASLVSLVLIGKPLKGAAHEALDVIAQASGQRTVIVAGVNDESSMVTGSASLVTRWRLGRSFGLLAGYDVRAVRFSGSGDASDSWYVRHLGFIGLSYAWVGSGTVSPMATLITPPTM